MVKKCVVLMLMSIVVAIGLTACGGNRKEDAESVIEFAELAPPETEPVIIRDETAETEPEREQETESQSSETEMVVPFVDRMAEGNPVSYQIENGVYEDESVKVTYPQFTGMENEDLQQRINENICQTALSGSDEEGVSAYELTYETAAAGKGVVSFIFRGYRNYEESAYPLNIVKTLNINMNNGETVRLKDYADIGAIVSCLENTNGYQIVNEGVESQDFAAFLNNGYMTDYGILLLDFDIDFSNADMIYAGYSAIRENHLILFIEAEHSMGDYVELVFEKEL